MKFTKILLVAFALACMLSLTGCNILGLIGGQDPTPDPGPGEQPGDTTCQHEFTDKVTAAYLNTAATCEAPATYFKSCKKCGAKGTDTFRYGNPAPHTLEEVIADEHIKIAADCAYGAEYYMTCSVCGQHGDETFMYGDPLQHDYQEVQDRAFMLNGASCTQAARYYESCTLCGAKGTKIFTVGHAEGHKFEEVAETAATMTTHGKVAHKVCTVCTLTFDLEENPLSNVPVIHNYTDFYDEEEGKHFHYCQIPNCEERECVGDHVYGGDCDPYCEDCNLVREVEVEHVDENGDTFCDVCLEPMPLPEPPKEDDTSDFDPF